MRQDHLSADAYNVWYSAKPHQSPSPDDGSLLANGSFERQVNLDDNTPFLTWRIGPQPV
jgi:hypothetical protein